MRKKGNYTIGEYISDTIGLTFRENGPAKELVKGLPQYLKGTFRFSFVEIEGQEFLLILPLTETDSSIFQIIKFAGQIRKQTGKPTLIHFKSMDSIRRRTLISNRENFVVPGKQIYLPALCMYLNESGSIRQFTNKETLSPAAQFLLLFHLQKISLDGVPFKNVAEMLSYSKKTVSVVVAELQKLSVCEVEQVNERNKVMRFVRKGRELWDSVSSRMISPVQKVWYVPKNVIPENLPLCASYDTALAHYTFMAATRQSSFAVERKSFSGCQEKLQPFLHPEDGDVRLEVWRYNPVLLADGTFIDRLSLILCYKDTDDERVRKEIHELTDEIVW